MPPGCPGLAATTGRLTNTHLFLLPIALASMLAGCGGGGGSPGVSSATPVTTTPTSPTVTANYLASQNLCAAPRSGIDPYTGKAYLDKAGTLTDERRKLH